MPLLPVMNELIFFMDCGGLCDRKIFTAEFTATSIKKIAVKLSNFQL